MSSGLIIRSIQVGKPLPVVDTNWASNRSLLVHNNCWWIASLGGSLIISCNCHLIKCQWWERRWHGHCCHSSFDACLMRSPIQCRCYDTTVILMIAVIPITRPWPGSYGRRLGSLLNCTRSWTVTNRRANIPAKTTTTQYNWQINNFQRRNANWRIHISRVNNY